jgi:hypothetical protein
LFLSKGGITVEVSHPTDIARYKKLGYVEPEIGYPHPEIIRDGEKAEKGEPKTLAIAEIYAMCDKAGVDPGDLKLDGEHPTLAEVKAAIKAAKKAVTDETT